jgi:hypothetical protein
MEAHLVIRLAFICLILTGCMKEPVDQGAHYAAGRAMAAEIMRDADATPERTINGVWCWAAMREAIQSGEDMRCGTDYPVELPEHWGEGKRRDMDYWRRGAEAGALGGN